MFSISPNGIITMTRGDSWTTSIFINIGTELCPIGYDLKEGDYVYFGVMEPNQPFNDALVCKKMTYKDKTPITSVNDVDINKDGYIDGFVTLTFGIKDTEYLLPGTYYYEVKLLRPISDQNLIEKGYTEQIDTIVPKTKFIILE